MADYYLKYNERISGPFPLDKLKAMAQDGLVTSAHAVSPDRENWLPADELAGLLPDTPAPIPEPTSPPESVPPPASADQSLPTPDTPPAIPASSIPPTVPVIPAGIQSPVFEAIGDFFKGRGKLRIKPTVIAGIVTLLALTFGVANGVNRQNAEKSYLAMRTDYYDSPQSYVHDRYKNLNAMSTSSTIDNILGPICALGLLAFSVSWLVTFYHGWRRLEPLRVLNPAIPGSIKATGFLLIPLFGIAWIFLCLSKAGVYFHAMEARRDPQGAKPSSPILHPAAMVLGGLMILQLLAGLFSDAAGSMLMFPVMASATAYLWAFAVAANRITVEK